MSPGEVLQPFAVSSSIIADLAPEHLRGHQGAFYLTIGLAVVAGPLVGPWLVRATDMRTMWLLCVALGGACAAGHLVLTGARRRRILVLGAASGLRD